MLIGELAERAGTSTRTLRYYEANGLVRAERQLALAIAEREKRCRRDP